MLLSLVIALIVALDLWATRGVVTSDESPLRKKMLIAYVWLAPVMGALIVKRDLSRLSASSHPDLQPGFVPVTASAQTDAPGMGGFPPGFDMPTEAVADEGSEQEAHGAADSIFIGLHYQLMGYEGDDVYRDILAPFIPAGKAAMAELSCLMRLKTALPNEVRRGDLEALFALNVCNDHLLRPLVLTRAEYQAFFTALGMSVIPQQKQFNPVLHEIVGVGSFVKEEQGVTTGAQYWPGLMFGEMVLSRAAVDVYCHPSFGLVEGIADTSTLYFTNARVRRKTADLSMGWGSNSRWRTDFHRNYVCDGKIWLNVDGSEDLHKAPHGLETVEGLPLRAARELLLNRCFVSFDAKGQDYFPYAWTMVIEGTESPWPLDPRRIVPRHEALESGD
jgi:hypothetical protein